LQALMTKYGIHIQKKQEDPANSGAS